MPFRFEDDLDHQLRAIDAIVDAFEGLPADSAGEIETTEAGLLAVTGNRLTPTFDKFLENVQAVQDRNGLDKDDQVATLPVSVERAVDDQAYEYPNFTIEMETGTGKTYVYLRTILALAEKYGLKKFVIVVPGVPIREGALGTIRDTRTHLKKLFPKVTYHEDVFDSSRMGRVSAFAHSDEVEILVMNIDAFNKAENLIFAARDQADGIPPIKALAVTRPVVIIDEPQNMESELSKEALASLNPLAALRYSATHRETYNLLYRLGPYDAYERGLVKELEVAGVEHGTDAALPYVLVDKIESPKGKTGAASKPRARLTVHKTDSAGRAVPKQNLYAFPDDLEAKTGRREYSGWEIVQISVGDRSVTFTNGRTLKEGQEVGVDKEAIFRGQIAYTIESHFKKQLELKARDIKVLSLFFIDEVANYVGTEEEAGLIARIFDEEHKRLTEVDVYKEFVEDNPADVRAAYFAQTKTRAGKVRFENTGEGASGAADRDAVTLIMREKERLLSFKEKRAFVFSHSALREGWDNPNVFQLCSLNQAISTVRKRQEIGRGVRICVDQSGERVFEDGVNVLTVIANESYSAFVDSYQAEIVEDFGEDAANKTPKPRNARAEKTIVRLQEQHLTSAEFNELWERVRFRTRYSVTIDTQALIVSCADALSQDDALASLREPKITVTLAKVTVMDEAFGASVDTEGMLGRLDYSERPQPNLLALVVDELARGVSPLRLTKATVLKIIRKAPNHKAALTNPSEWAAMVARVIREQAVEQIVNGIKYHQLPESDWYTASQLKVELPSTTLKEGDVPRGLVKVANSVYDFVIYDAVNEKNYVEEDLDVAQDSRVKVFVKLPSWFVVDTPLGTYNPDWAIAFERRDHLGRAQKMLYLVRETKSTLLETELRPSERRKILCGRAHFAEAPKPIDFAIDVPGGGVRLPGDSTPATVGSAASADQAVGIAAKMAVKAD